MESAVTSPSAPEAYSRRQALLYGVRDASPLILGGIIFDILFGALGIEAGLSPMAVIGFAVFVFAGSAQLVAVQLYSQGVSIPVIIMTTLIINLRHLLYGASLGPYVKNLSQRWLIPLGFALSDEIYALVFRQYQTKRLHPHWYHLGVCVSVLTVALISTLIGILAGTQFKGLANLGVDFVLVAMLIGIVVPLIVNRPMLVSALVAGGIALITAPLPNKMGLLISAIAGILAGLIAESFFPAQKETSTNANAQ
jgi:4-azaleucine resistance transporter AzlC